MADQNNQNLLSTISDLFHKFAFGQNALGQAAGAGTPAPQQAAPNPDAMPNYVQDSVNAYMKQKQQQALIDAAKKAKGTKKPAGGGAPQSQVDTSAPYLNLFHSLIGNLS